MFRSTHLRPRLRQPIFNPSEMIRGNDLQFLCDRSNCYHQQYLHKVPNGYCGMGGTGVSCPIGTGVESTER
jgi:hypothetical protein